MGHYSHIVRFGIILTGVIVVFFAIRTLVVPESFGIQGSYMYGYHRGDSDAEQAGLPELYQGTDKCRKCHADQYESKTKSGHAGLACETCHGPWEAHNNNTKDKVLKDTSVAACLLCHQKLDARPLEFPQIKSLKQHMEEQEQEVEADIKCVECHDPHEPL